ncbi:MAG TPA: peptidoglycan DD-metalloendopeptidase family protein [Xanthomonadaceae bacterium]|nr:peptidoglycan DD-metalloendopeptidase family protein [Xanthomonadaceae bacterium]
MRRARLPARAPRSPLPGALTRMRREHWILASTCAGLVVLVAAIAPGFAQAMRASAEPERETLALRLPALPAEAPPLSDDLFVTGADQHWRTVRVESGQSLGDIFDAQGLSAAQLHRLLAHPSARQALARIYPGDEFAFEIDARGRLRAMQFDRDEGTRVVLHFSGEKVSERVIERELQHRVQYAAGTIEGSLYAAGLDAGMSDATIMALAKVFGYDIDFAQDLRRGDRFSVVYDEVWRDGERLRSGDILAATFVNQGRTYQVFRYEFADGRRDYYDAEGRPVKKSFLRMPIEFARISSRFTSARKHPVLGRTRAHRGVDYAANSGTPIMSAGDGKVGFVGWKSGYGRTVIVDHGRGYTTLYAHMSRFGRHKMGARVRQGDVIGHVGASGLATGPHLHYEFRVKGVHQDPLKVTLPKPEPLPASELARFRLQQAPMFAQLRLVAEGTTYAAAR